MYIREKQKLFGLYMAFSHRGFRFPRVISGIGFETLERKIDNVFQDELCKVPMPVVKPIWVDDPSVPPRIRDEFVGDILHECRHLEMARTYTLLSFIRTPASFFIYFQTLPVPF